MRLLRRIRDVEIAELVVMPVVCRGQRGGSGWLKRVLVRTSMDVGKLLSC